MRVIKSHPFHFVMICLVAFGALSLTVLAQEATPESTPTAQASQFDIPPEIAAHESEWPLGNHDYANTRAAVNSQINASNVKSLGVAWTVSLKGISGWGAAAGNPLISDGLAYFQDLGANIYVVDMKTGDKIWQATYDNQIFGPGGLGIGYGKIYAYTRVDRFAALDIKSGKELWNFNTGAQSPAGAFQPSAFDHTIYTATQAAAGGQGQTTFHSYQGGASGLAYALNPDTGDVKWRWQAVEEGFWGHPEINSGGGIWYPTAIDTATGITYWPTGNPSPIPGLKDYPNGSSRPGPNLYTNSMIALDHVSGKMLWYNQVLPHDLFNLDFQVSPILATTQINGSNREIVIGSGKLGRVIGFDRQTGEKLWDTSVGLHMNDTLQQLPLDQTIVWVAPGAWGGVETPMAYADGVIYALVDNLPSPYNATANGSTNGEDALNESEGGTLYKNGNAEMDAIDVSTGKILWKTTFDRIAFAGATVVNDLVFTATLDGMIMALSRKDGSIVWQYQAPGGTNAWPAVSGDTILWPIGIGDHPIMLALRLNANAAIPTPEELRTPVQTPAGL